MVNNVWFMTGAGRGFGRHWAQVALRRGDLVVATARVTSALSGLVETYGAAVLPLQPHVTDPAAARDAVAWAHQAFGRIDVVVNNAGYGPVGAVEEVTEEQARAQMETIFVGALWITRAVLPYLHTQRSGHIVQVSSIGGIATYPGVSLYCASKWALEAISEALAHEVAEFGIRVALVEPGPFAAAWAGSSLVWADAHPAYAPVHASLRSDMDDISPAGNSAATAPAILALVDAELPPLRLFLGVGVLDATRASYERRMQTWEQWDDVARAAQAA
jgi:NAD(P)-dependent dehydrogenase (short-subunit alcohol dehydrogenase family)